MSPDCPIVVLDACVLYPAGLRSLMMWLAVYELIQPKWTEQIHDEWMRNVLKDRPDLTKKKLERTRQLMDAHAGDCLVTDYEEHMEGMALPDRDDCHVVAAGVKAGADAIITWNLGDFPRKVIKGYGIEVQTPDQLINALLDAHEEKILEAMRAHRASLKHPPKSPTEYLKALEIQLLKKSAARLQHRVDQL